MLALVTGRRDFAGGRIHCRPPQGVRRQAAFAAAAVALGVTLATGCSSGSFCQAAGSGPTAADAAAMFVARCGGDYKISRGPYAADKGASAYPGYADLVEFDVSVRDNDEGSLGFLLVGRETAQSSWRTLGTLGAGP